MERRTKIHCQYFSGITIPQKPRTLHIYVSNKIEEEEERVAYYKKVVIRGWE